jgi:hypothetical protein
MIFPFFSFFSKGFYKSRSKNGVDFSKSLINSFENWINLSKDVAITYSFFLFGLELKLFIDFNDAFKLASEVRFLSSLC